VVVIVIILFANLMFTFHKVYKNFFLQVSEYIELHGVLCLWNVCVCVHVHLFMLWLLVRVE